MNDQQRALHDAVLKRLADEGRLIEAGFVAMRAAIIPVDASEGQISDMRIAYMAGAQHLYASMMSVMDSDREPTPRDLLRMAAIDTELRSFEGEIKLRAARTKGSA